jgi:ABC-type nitrate/sulfonate/bicarbonate transport system permease component
MRGALVPLAAVALIELLSRVHAIDPVLFPAPSTIVIATIRAIGPLARDGTLTVVRAAVSFAVALLVAIPSGLVLGRSDRLHALFRPSVDGLRTLPAAAIVPIAILLLGIDTSMKVAVAAFGAAWPVLLATIDGVHAVSPVMRDTIRTLHLTRRQAFVRVIFPAALPYILTGARISLSVTLILAVTVEMVAGDSGLGFFVLDAERSFRFPEMYGGVAALALIGAALNAGMRSLEKRLVYWR